MSDTPSLPDSERARLTHCLFSSDINGQLTAGRGALDAHGYFEFPCEECVTRAERRMAHDAALTLRAESAEAENAALKADIDALHLVAQGVNHYSGCSPECLCVRCRWEAAEAELTVLRARLEQVERENERLKAQLRPPDSAVVTRCNRCGRTMAVEGDGHVCVRVTF